MGSAFHEIKKDRRAVWVGVLKKREVKRNSPLR